MPSCYHYHGAYYCWSKQLAYWNFILIPPAWEVSPSEEVGPPSSSQAPTCNLAPPKVGPQSNYTDSYLPSGSCHPPGGCWGGGRGGVGSHQGLVRPKLSGESFPRSRLACHFCRLPLGWRNRFHPPPKARFWYEVMQTPQNLNFVNLNLNYASFFFSVLAE